MSDLAILIPSFDKYSDIWPLTAFSLGEYWPQCPYPIYLGANGDDRSAEVPKSWCYINKGPDLSWSRSMADYLSAIPETRILLYLDDFIMTAPPDEALIKRALGIMRTSVSAFIQLKPKKSCNRSFDDDFMIVPRWNDYRTSLMPTIWNKDLLVELLRYDFNPWQFERRAGLAPESQASFFLTAKKDAMPFHHCVQKGEILPWVDDYFQALGFKLPIAPARKRMSEKEAAASRDKLPVWRRVLLKNPVPLHVMKAVRFFIAPPQKKW